MGDGERKHICLIKRIHIYGKIVLMQSFICLFFSGVSNVYHLQAGNP